MGRFLGMSKADSNIKHVIPGHISTSKEHAFSRYANSKTEHINYQNTADSFFNRYPKVIVI